MDWVAGVASTSPFITSSWVRVMVMVVDTPAVAATLKSSVISGMEGTRNLFRTALQ